MADQPPLSEDQQKLSEIQLILQYLADPENLTSPDSEHIRAITAQRALDCLEEYRRQIEAA